MEKPIRILRLSAVEDRTGLKRDSIYRLGKLGQFPKPVKISQWASGWVENEIDAYLAARVAERDAKTTCNTQVHDMFKGDAIGLRPS